MRIYFPKETHNDENRVALIPEHAKKLVALGLKITIAKGFAEIIGIKDEEYKNCGVDIASTSDFEVPSDCGMVLRVRRPDMAIVKKLPKGMKHVSFLDPFNEKELIDGLASQGVTTFSLEMIPRTTKAQKMDVLSSQASLAGYAAVILAQSHLKKIYPMMMTPAGTISPSRIFIIGAGVAGLQAIATAKRLGARVDAFDTRPVVEEQVQSLGAKFVKVDLGEMGQTKDGYAKALTKEQLEKQREVMAKYCAMSDVVITTAQLFGRKAPIIVTKEMLDGMKPGSVLVDLAVETGGNVEGSKVGEVADHNGVKIIGQVNMPGLVSAHASQMLSANFYYFLEEFFDKEKKEFILDLEDEILKGCTITHEGKIVNERIK